MSETAAGAVARPGPCRCVTDYHWKTGRSWAVRVAGELLGYSAMPDAADAELADNLVCQVLAIVRLAWPCTCGAAPPTVDPEQPQASECGRARARVVIDAWLLGRVEERAVLDVLKYLTGDHGRRSAACTSYGARPERHVDRVLDLTERERLTAVVLINGVAAKRHSVAARWAAGGTTDAELARYVLDRVRPRRGSLGHRPESRLVGEPVELVAQYVCTTREALRKADPERWDAFVALSRSVLTSSPTRIDNEGSPIEVTDSGTARSLDGTEAYLERDAASANEADRWAWAEKLLEEISTVDELERLLDALSLLDADPHACAVRLQEAERAWQRFLRCGRPRPGRP